jgi:hypothetical protein
MLSRTTLLKADWLLNCCLPSRKQRFLVPNPTGLMAVFYCLMALEAFRPPTLWVSSKNTRIYEFSPYLTGNILRHNYKSQPVNAVWGTVLVYCENHMEHTDVHKFSSYLTGNTTTRLRYKSQPVIAVWRNSPCLVWEPYGTHSKVKKK